MREPDSPLLDSWIILVGMPRSINVQIYIRRPWSGMVLTKLNVPYLVKTQSYPVISDKLTVWMTHADLKIVARRKKKKNRKNVVERFFICSSRYLGQNPKRLQIRHNSMDLQDDSIVFLDLVSPFREGRKEHFRTSTILMTPLARRTVIASFQAWQLVFRSLIPVL